MAHVTINFYSRPVSPPMRSQSPDHVVEYQTSQELPLPYGQLFYRGESFVIVNESWGTQIPETWDWEINERENSGFRQVVIYTAVRQNYYNLYSSYEERAIMKSWQ